ncbi:hypothetical protein [Agrococcus casei]|uniref:Uncharacterized protein n=2 Tax=Agrococcus TaxID=46352 RepID=A0A1R4FD89_9MICO|nr:hypothetical protein [Agrococcus casei]SJM53868.1 hypothetical protein CZ674_03980 [Agrococcus casei LMG 22410]
MTPVSPAPASRIRAVPTILFGALWGALQSVLLVLAFGVLPDALELIDDSTEDGCGCGQDPIFTTTMSGLTEVVPVLVLPLAASAALAGAVGWLWAKRRGGVASRHGAWYGAAFALMTALLLPAVALLIHIASGAWGDIDWPTMVGPTAAGLALVPLSALAGWTIVRVQRPRIRDSDPASDTSDDTIVTESA